MERTMPGYFDVLGARYSVPALLAEFMGIMDLAFLAANYRFTQVVAAKMYRCGLAGCPLDAEWLEAKSSGSAGGGLEPSAPTSSGSGAVASGAPRAGLAIARAAGTSAAGSIEVGALGGPPRGVHAHPLAAACAAAVSALKACLSSGPSSAENGQTAARVHCHLCI